MRQEIRGSDVFLRADLAAIIKALALTAQAGERGEYTRGFLAALAAMAVALHVAPGDVDLATMVEVGR